MHRFGGFFPPVSVNTGQERCLQEEDVKEPCRTTLQESPGVPINDEEGCTTAQLQSLMQGPLEFFTLITMAFWGGSAEKCQYLSQQCQ